MILGRLRKSKQKCIDFFRSEKMEIESPKLFQFIELSLNLMIKKVRLKVIGWENSQKFKKIDTFVDTFF